jgi:hypothetical protein
MGLGERLVITSTKEDTFIGERLVIEHTEEDFFIGAANTIHFSPVTQAEKSQYGLGERIV